MTVRTHFILSLALVLGACTGAAGIKQVEADSSSYEVFDSGKFALTVRFRVKTEHLADFQEAIRARVLSVRRDRAAIDFRLFTTEDRHAFVVFESFESPAAWTAFAKKPESVAFLASIAHMQASPYQVQFLNLVDCKSDG